ncbi:MAG: membrane protein insertase YidC, partial [Nitrospinota bacterium]
VRMMGGCQGCGAADVTLRWEGNPSAEGLAVVWGPGIKTEGREGDRYATTGPVTYRNGKLVFVKGKDLKERKAILQRGKITWTSIHSKYFMAAFIPRSEFEGALIREDSGVLVGLQFAGGSRGEGKFSLFAGPKDQTVLKAYGASLEEAIDLGWFSFVAKPLLSGLRLFHKWTGSYGVAIILLTVLIKILFYPLTQKSTKSMQEMQRLQPKMKQIREIFKDDRQRMNEEVMKLYREHKVNPLGGCLPMLLQIPVFFALYNALLGSIELRQAPFLWMKDLSLPETGLFMIPGVGVEFRLLVLLMGVSMFLPQKMTPAASDPTQQKMMLFMPIIFTFLFWSFPAGLVVYWFSNNVLSIGQQYYTLRVVKQPRKAPPGKKPSRKRPAAAKASKAGKN